MEFIMICGYREDTEQDAQVLHSFFLKKIKWYQGLGSFENQVFE